MKISFGAYQRSTAESVLKIYYCSDTEIDRSPLFVYFVGERFTVLTREVHLSLRQSRCLSRD